jgi:hypothetical protein
MTDVQTLQDELAQCEKANWHNFNVLQRLTNYLLDKHLDKFDPIHTEKEGDQGEAAAQNFIDCIERIAKSDISVSVARMTEAGFEDGQPRYTYFVNISRGGKSITPHSYKEEWKAKYEVAEYAEFFGVQAFNWDGTPITESADDILFGDHS